MTDEITTPTQHDELLRALRAYEKVAEYVTEGMHVDLSAGGSFTSIQIHDVQPTALDELARIGDDAHLNQDDILTWVVMFVDEIEITWFRR